MNNSTWYRFLFVGLFFNHKAFLRKGTKRRGKEIKKGVHSPCEEAGCIHPERSATVRKYVWNAKWMRQKSDGWAPDSKPQGVITCPHAQSPGRVTGSGDPSPPASAPGSPPARPHLTLHLLRPAQPKPCLPLKQELRNGKMGGPGSAWGYAFKNVSACAHYGAIYANWRSTHRSTLYS